MTPIQCDHCDHPAPTATLRKDRPMTSRDEAMRKAVEQAGDNLLLSAAMLAPDLAATAGADAERKRIVAWMKSESALCDCYAREENECACGAWDDYKMVPLVDIIDAIERGDHWKEGEI